MKSVEKDHPWKRILIRRDEISGNNHPWKRIFIRRDDISRDESSLEVDFYPQG